MTIRLERSAESMANDPAFSSRYVSVVEHGTDPDVARPTAVLVIWVGAVEPNNAEPGDVRINPDGVVEYLPLDGGTLTGPLVLDADPATDMEAATKRYVDTGPARERAALRLDRLIAWDTFDRGNGPLGTAESGQTWTKVETSASTFNVVDGVAVKTAGGLPSGQVLDVGVADVEIQVSMWHDYTAAAGNLGIIARYIDDNNYLLFDAAVPAFPDQVRLRRKLSGSFTDLAVVTGLPPISAERSYRFDVVGNMLLGFIDGQLVIQHKLTGGDETTFGSSTVVGIYGSQFNVYAADFTVREVRGA